MQVGSSSCRGGDTGLHPFMSWLDFIMSHCRCKLHPETIAHELHWHLASHAMIRAALACREARWSEASDAHLSSFFQA